MSLQGGFKEARCETASDIPPLVEDPSQFWPQSDFMNS
jgi:hypothetical protein